MTGYNFAQIIQQIRRVVSQCFDWFENLIYEVGALPLLMFVFAVGTIIRFFIIPFMGFGMSVGADVVAHRINKKADQKQVGSSQPRIAKKGR